MLCVKMLLKKKEPDRDLLMRNVNQARRWFIQVPAIMGENEEGEA